MFRYRYTTHQRVFIKVRIVYYNNETKKSDFSCVVGSWEIRNDSATHCSWTISFFWGTILRAKIKQSMVKTNKKNLSKVIKKKIRNKFNPYYQLLINLFWLISGPLQGFRASPPSRIYDMGPHHSLLHLNFHKIQILL